MSFPSPKECFGVISMREIAFFVEDHAHHELLKALVTRLVHEHGLKVHLDWRNVRRGHGAVMGELRQYLRDLLNERGGYPDLIVVATDANCKGLNAREKEITEVTAKVPVRVVCAVPDPHIERWLLLDSAAFKAVFNRGCEAPDLKCERARYKKMLIDNIRQANITPSLGGIEFAADIVEAMDLDRIARLDPSFRRFLEALIGVFREWQS